MTGPLCSAWALTARRDGCPHDSCDLIVTALQQSLVWLRRPRLDLPETPGVPRNLPGNPEKRPETTSNHPEPPIQDS